MISRHLILVRHARAVRQTAGERDFDRRLTDDGRRDAEQMARLLVREGVAMDAVVSSPAPRAAETARVLAGARELSLPVRTEVTMYEATARTLSEIARGFNDSWGAAWLVGHNPGLSHFADWLLGEPTVLDMPTCAAVWLELPLASWTQLKAGGASLRGRWSPQMLVKPGTEGRKDRKG